MTQPAADRGYIDVNAQVGPRFGGARGAPLEDLVAERDGHDIRFSLVRHRTALHGESELGNRTLLDLCTGQPGLLPVAVLSVDRTGDVDRAAGLAAQVAGFWLDGTARPGGGLAADPVVRAAARTGRPLFVPVTGRGSTAAVGAATEGLGVPVIMIGSHYTTSVDDLAAGQRYEHLHFDTSSMAHYRAIETAVGVVGAERILLGTGSPLRAVQSSINAILSAAIPDESKRAILAGNAERLFDLRRGSVNLPEVVRPERAFDTHTHSGPMPWDVPDEGDDALMPALERANRTGYAVASSVLAIAADLEAGNRRTVEGCARMPTRLGYLVADPNDIEASRDQLRRWGGEPGIVGVKVHTEWSHRHTGSRQIADLFRVLADHGRPVKIHNDGPDWDQHLLRIAREHPRLPIIIAHAGLGFPNLEGALIAREADNIHAEMSSSFAQLATVREFIRTIPAEKMLFGTDAPLLDPSFVLGTYQDAQIPAADQAAIYYGNAARLFGLD
jgi:predicted TIM-barrel fold metal-dependent hydrolase